MLNPDTGQIYSDALRPPAGFRFTRAVAATYSLDLETLLTFPLHLALFSAEQPKEELLADALGLLEALRRTSGEITVFSNAGRILAPRNPHPLYGLLEPVVAEALPPDPNGAFHPKLWLIRFDDPETGEIALRLLVLTRNLTDDRSWDLVLTLDGVPGTRNRQANAPLADLIAALPSMAAHPLPEARIAAMQELAELARRAEWELPGEFQELRFHAPGLRRGRGWLPETSGEMVIVSPFLSAPALTALLKSTKRPVGLVSRPEELAAIDPDILRQFEDVWVLNERAERENGEEAPPESAGQPPVAGLHAKVYAVKRGWDTHLYVGSANATSPALLSGANIELVAELVGRRSRVGAVEDLLGSDGLGPILSPYTPDAAPEPSDPDFVAAEDELDRIRRDLARCGLRARFRRDDAGWTTTLSAREPPLLPPNVTLSAWLVTRQVLSSVDVSPLATGEEVGLPASAVALLTSFIAFELRSLEQPVTARFVLSVETIGLPTAERDAAILRDVIRNRAGFLRYIMLLLAEIETDADSLGAGFGSWKRFTGSAAGVDDAPLFETLTRAYCREPERLDAIRDLIQELGAGSATDECEPLVPEEFLALWEVFDRGQVDEEVARP